MALPAISQRPNMATWSLNHGVAPPLSDCFFVAKMVYFQQELEGIFHLTTAIPFGG